MASEPSVTTTKSNGTVVPHVTIIRPVKGIEPYLYECIAAACHQDYPREKLSIYLCVASKRDPAIPILEQLVCDFPTWDVRIFIGDDDPALFESVGAPPCLGPNPKIRNISRAYREAKGDIVWILDCNVWVNSGVCGRMVDRLTGRSPDGPKRPYKFVHQLPICVEVDWQQAKQQTYGIHQSEMTTEDAVVRNACPQKPTSLSWQGGRLEGLFLSSSHAKFYTAINTVAVAPCIVGKSNMFRRSHLNYLTSTPRDQKSNTSSFASVPDVGLGVDYFSHNICEDHLIGDLLWRGEIPFAPKDIGNHALLYGDLAIQPISDLSITGYIARRVRWLRVRKFTVPVATFVEPGTESFLCSAYLAWALTALDWFRERVPFSVSSPWTTFAALWLASVCLWSVVDWNVYLLLHSGRTIPARSDSETSQQEKADGKNNNNHLYLRDDDHIPSFVRPSNNIQKSRRHFFSWLFAWMGRETLALPIWIWAIWGGVTVAWKDQKYWVGMDMRVHQLSDSAKKEGKKGKETISEDVENKGKRRRVTKTPMINGYHVNEAKTHKD